MATHAKSTSFKYLLGDSRRETARLHGQAAVWDPVSHALFDRLGIRKGWKILEVGPGAGSLYGDLRRRVRGPVDAVERSQAFADDLARKTRRDKLGAGRIWQCDLLDAHLPRNHYDLIFARWVFLFLPDPVAHLRLLMRALAPGGRIAIQDYHRETFCMIPPPPEWDDFIAADIAFFASQGGDASIGGRLPAMMRTLGLRVDTPHVTVKTGAPGSPEWNWMTTYFDGVMGDYATFAPMTPAMGRSLLRRWHAAERDSSAVLVAPAVVDVVGRRRK